MQLQGCYSLYYLFSNDLYSLFFSVYLCFIYLFIFLVERTLQREHNKRRKDEERGRRGERKKEKRGGRRTSVVTSACYTTSPLFHTHPSETRLLCAGDAHYCARKRIARALRLRLASCACVALAPYYIIWMLVGVSPVMVCFPLFYNFAFIFFLYFTFNYFHS